MARALGPPPGAAALAASLPAAQQPQRHLHPHQARLTPIVAPGSKQQRAASVEPVAEQQPGLQLESGAPSEAQPAGSASPMQVAEPSQQVGLSPGAAGQEMAAPQDGAAEADAAAPQAAGPPPAEAAVAAAAATPALPASPAAPRGVRRQTGAAAEWQALLDAAQLLVREIEEANAEDGAAFRPDPFLATPEQREQRYGEVVSGGEGEGGPAGTLHLGWAGTATAEHACLLVSPA